MFCIYLVFSLEMHMDCIGCNVYFIQIMLANMMGNYIACAISGNNSGE